MARPTRASANPNIESEPTAAGERQQRPAGMLHHLARCQILAALSVMQLADQSLRVGNMK